MPLIVGGMFSNREMAGVLGMIGVEMVSFGKDENMRCFGPMFSHY